MMYALSLKSLRLVEAFFYTVRSLSTDNFLRVCGNRGLSSFMVRRHVLPLGE